MMWWCDQFEEIEVILSKREGLHVKIDAPNSRVRGRQCCTGPASQKKMELCPPKKLVVELKKKKPLECKHSSPRSQSNWGENDTEARKHQH